MRILVKNARIADGTGKDLFDGAVLIEDERIVSVPRASSIPTPTAT